MAQAKRKPNVFIEGLKVPELYGTEKEYGIRYPTGHKVSGDPSMVSRALEMIQSESQEILTSPTPTTMALPDRETYVKELDRRLNAQFGRDPRNINVFSEALKMYNQKLKPFWSHVFPKIPHGGMLDEDQQKYWAKAKEQLMARCYNSVKGYVTTQGGMYTRARAEGMALYEEKKEEREKRVGGIAKIKTEERVLARQLEKEKRAEARTIAAEARKGGEKPSITEERMTAKDVAKAEEVILTNPDEEAVIGQVDFFNQYSKKPYVYIWTEGKPKGFFKKGIEAITDMAFAEGELAKIKLPVIKGKQVYAKDVWDTAQKRRMTFEEVLKKIGALK